MSARLELDDLPPRYRAQAEKQLAQRRCSESANQHRQVEAPHDAEP